MKTICVRHWGVVNRKSLARWVILVSLFGVSCAPLKEVRDFGKASAQVNEAAISGYLKFNTEIRDARSEIGVIRNESVNFSTSVGPFDQSDRLKTRMKALEELAAYAEGLEALATKDPSGDIKGSAIEMKTSLQSLNKKASSLNAGNSFFSDDVIGIVSGAGAVIGDTYQTIARRNKIREIVKAANPGVQLAAEALSREFASMGQVAKIQFDDLREAFQGEANKASHQLGDRLEFNRAALRHADASRQAVPAYGKISVAAKHFGTAHQELFEAADTRKLSSKELVAAIKDLSSEAKDAKALFDAVK